MTPDEVELHAAMQSERRHLVSLAYHVLGELPDAEEAVQDTYICWYRLSAESQASVAEPRAWLTRTLGRMCLYVLTSADRPIDASFSTWPEEGAAVAVPNEATPAERITMILHDGFGMDLDEIAEIIGRTPEACRRLARTARRRTAEDRTERLARAQRNDHVRALISVARRRDIAGLSALLDPCVRFRAAGSGSDHDYRLPIIGARRVARHLVRPLRTYPDTTILEQETPDGLGFSLWEDGCIVGVANIELAGGIARDIRLSTVPRRLTLWS